MNNRTMTRTEWLELYSSIRGNGLAYTIRTNQYIGFDAVLNQFAAMEKARDYLAQRAREYNLVNRRLSNTTVKTAIAATTTDSCFNKWHGWQ